MKPSNWKPTNITITTAHETNHTHYNHIHNEIIHVYSVAKLIAIMHKSFHSLSPNTQAQKFIPEMDGPGDHVGMKIFIAIQYIY